MPYFHWVVDEDNPEGHQVEYTADETTERDALIAAAAPLIQQEEDALLVESQLRDKIDQALSILENANNKWNDLTPTQKDTALRAGVRAQAALIRLIFRKLDAPG